MPGLSGAFRRAGLGRRAIHLTAAEMPDCAAADPTGRRNISFQFRRRGAVEYLALRAFEQIEFVGFDRERTAHAL